MELVDRDDLLAFARSAAPPCVSMFLPVEPPTSRQGRETTRLRSLINDARRRLEADGVDDATIERMLAPAVALRDQTTRPYAQARGLALLLTADDARVLQLPVALDEYVAMSATPDLWPIADVFSPDERLLVVALSLHEVQVFEATRQTLDEVAVPSLADELAGLLEPGDREHTLQMRAASSGPGDAAFFHGHGGAKDVSDARRSSFLHAIDRALRPVFNERGLPVVIAGVADLADEYRKVAAGVEFIGTVPGTPHNAPAAAMLDAAWRLAEASGHTAQARARARFERANDQGLTEALDMPAIAQAAHDGRVGMFLVPAAGTTGRDDATRDVVNATIQATLEHAGEVVRLNDEGVGMGLPAAILRY